MPFRAFSPNLSSFSRTSSHYENILTLPEKKVGRLSCGHFKFKYRVRRMNIEQFLFQVFFNKILFQITVTVPEWEPDESGAATSD